MKKTFLLIVAVLLGAGGLMAQSWSGGVILGFSASQVDGDSYGGYKKLGLVAGGFARRNLSERLGLQPEIVFNQRGAREVKDLLFWHSRFNYIDVPVLLSYEVYRKGNQRLLIQGGPQFGALLGGTLSVADKDNRVDVSNDLHRYEVSGLLGPDFYMTDNLSVNLRFGYSLIRFNKKVQNSPLDFRSGMFHHYFQFSLRYDLNPL